MNQLFNYYYTEPDSPGYWRENVQGNHLSFELPGGICLVMAGKGKDGGLDRYQRCFGPISQGFVYICILLQPRWHRKKTAVLQSISLSGIQDLREYQPTPSFSTTNWKHQSRLKQIPIGRSGTHTSAPRHNWKNAAIVAIATSDLCLYRILTLPRFPLSSTDLN